MDEYVMDDWPTMPDGSNFDGEQLLTLVRDGNSPFNAVWDVNLLIQEIEDNLGATVVDIPVVSKGSNHYGFHVKLSNSKDIMARLAREDVNMPVFNGFPLRKQVIEVEFEAATYKLLRSEPQILASRLLYHRIPVQHPGPRLNAPQDILGRRLFLFEKAEGQNNVWWDLQEEGRAFLLTQAARIRASLFNFNPPLDFAADWFLKRLFEQKPELLPLPVAPTRDFWISVLTTKIEATIKNIGDMIGWEGDNATVGPIAAAAKQPLLRLVPHIMPAEGEEPSLYRIVLEHGDFGIHNMSITTDSDGRPLVTSLYDWETGSIAPAILSDPLMAVAVDLVTDENGASSITRVEDDVTPENYAEYMSWAKQYFEVLFTEAPDYERVIRAGKDVRHLWCALRDWRGDDPEGYFGELGTWAENRLKELGD